jgi:signal transduction histidine kinase
MRTVYPLPLRSVYEYTVRRGSEIFSAAIPFSRQVTPLAIQLRLPPSILTLAGWLVGAIVLFFAKRDNEQAIHAGYIFLFGSVVGSSIQAAIYGVPGAWITGHVLLFFMFPVWLYLGYIPRTTSLNTRFRVLLTLSVALASVLALMAAYEYLYLFPKPSSFQEVEGISLYALGLLLGGLGLLACAFVLGWRAYKMPRHSYVRQQLLVLLLVIGTGTLPAVLLTILPRALFDVTLLPFPIAIALMSLIPAGYLFVIYRKGFLGLDLFFSRTIYLILLFLFGFGIYAGGLYLVQRVLHLDGLGAVAPATVVFFPSFWLAIYVNEPLHQFVDRLVYGKVALNQDALKDFLHILTVRPELDTLKHIVISLAQMMDVPQAMLVLKDEGGSPTVVTAINVDEASLTLQGYDVLDGPLLRSVENRRAQGTEPLFASFRWAEMLLPITIRDEQVGLLAFSRPGPDGYFNARQVSFLDQAARVLAVGTENVLLFESARKMARQMLVVREQERKRVSMQLHDEPLHQVTYATTVLDHMLTKHLPDCTGQAGPERHELAAKLTTVAEHLREAAISLRNICTNLYLPFQDQGIKVAVEEATDHFRHEYGVQSTLEYAGADEAFSRVPAGTSRAVSRVLNGALLNVVKHAPGANVHVLLSCNDNSLILCVSDDGPGSHVAELSYTELIRRGHLGLVGMFEWAQYAQGQLQILPNEPTGVTVRLDCPLQG